MTRPDFPHGAAAIRETLAHYRDEVKPWAQANGHSREATRRAARIAVDRIFDQAWPEDDSEGKA